MEKRNRKDEMLRARVEQSLKDDVLLVARLQQIDEADVVRIAVRRLVAQFKTPHLPAGQILLNG